MKYTSIILALAAAIGSASAQDKQTAKDSIAPASSKVAGLDLPLWAPQNNYLSIALSGGLQSLKYDLEIGERSPMGGGSVNIDYNVFFSKKWGISFGAGASIYNSKSKIDTRCVSFDRIPVTYYDGTTEIESCKYYTDFSGWEEIQTSIAAETPIGLLYRNYLKGNTTLLLGAGVKLMYPVKTSYRVKAGKRITSGYLEIADLDLGSNLPQHGYYTKYDRPSGTTETKHFAAGMYFDLNLVHKMPNIDFFYGIYGTLGLTDISKIGYIRRANKNLTDIDNYCGVLSSNAVNEVNINAVGVRVGVKIPCPRLKDNDNDGVLDKFDKCLGTPAGVDVDTCGCPFDTDKDSVPDYLDKCPNTPKGVAVDANGCPIDSDNDGVADYLDQCPDTPDTVAVDDKGCPFDTDGDGVPDYLDKCPNTPEGRKVDTKGCPFDTDGDGVNDVNDKCPDTPEGVQVDAKGCPIDSDSDGVPDYIDKCPNIKGVPENGGCPTISAKVQAVFKQAMHGIQFQTGKAIIKKTSYPIVDKVVKVMKSNPEYKLIISGHTDNVGDPEKNMKLSKDRAAAVAKYIKGKGIRESRLRSSGYGDTKPIASNKIEKGRKQNRRVDFEVEF